MKHNLLLKLLLVPGLLINLGLVSYDTRDEWPESRLLFAADDGVHGVELWKSTGTLSGTVMIKDINPGSAPSAPMGSIAMNGILYFTANDGSSGTGFNRSFRVVVRP